MEPLEGKMAETSGSQTVSTKLERIAKLAREMPGVPLSTLAHHIDLDWLKEAYRRTRKDGAEGVDGQSAQEYATNLEENLRSLLERAKSGTYRAPPVRRVQIPKGDGSERRPIGIPTFEDKILQRAVSMVLSAVYEEEFLPCSYGFRPGRSAHQALEELREGLMEMGGGWLLEVDIKKFFDTMEHKHLREILSQRVRDGVLLRLIGKWLHAGVLEEGELSYPEAGTPQGGVVSPLLANIYLHEVLDKWFEKEVRPRIHGRAFLVRYADDFVIAFAREEDARRVKEVLPKRMGKYGLTLHPEKTRLVKFGRPPKQGPPAGGGKQEEPGSFELLGFLHYWGRSRKGRWVVKRRTAGSRLRRSLKRLREWCRRNRHKKVAEQQKELVKKVKGHYAYFGIRGNLDALKSYWHEAKRAWREWLNRRSDRARMSWERMKRLLERYPLPPPQLRRGIGKPCAAKP
jgi:RNA-directed DNA polymerase